MESWLVSDFSLRGLKPPAIDTLIYLTYFIAQGAAIEILIYLTYSIAPGAQAPGN